MPIAKYATKREQFGTRADNAQELERVALAKGLNRCPFLSPKGRLISVKFSAGATVIVKHGLGVPAACIVARQNYDTGTASVRLAENVNTTGIDANQQLALVADATAIFDLWFYPRASQVIPVGSSQSP